MNGFGKNIHVEELSETEELWRWCCKKFLEPQEKSKQTLNRLKSHIIRNRIARERYLELSSAISEAVEFNQVNSSKDRS